MYAGSRGYKRQLCDRVALGVSSRRALLLSTTHVCGVIRILLRAALDRPSVLQVGQWHEPCSTPSLSFCPAYAGAAFPYSCGLRDPASAASCISHCIPNHPALPWVLSNTDARINSTSIQIFRLAKYSTRNFFCLPRFGSSI